MILTAILFVAMNVAQKWLIVAILAIAFVLSIISFLTRKLKILTISITTTSIKNFYKRTVKL